MSVRPGLDQVDGLVEGLVRGLAGGTQVSRRCGLAGKERP